MASNAFAELLVRIGADISEYTQGIDDAISKGKEAESAFSSLGTTLSASITAPLAAVGAAAMEAAREFKDATNEIIVGTGAMGDKLQSLRGSFSNVFADVPVAAKEVGSAIATIHRSLDLTGEPLEKLTKQLVDLANITGSEVGPLVQSSVQLFKQWQVATEDQAGTL